MASRATARPIGVARSLSRPIVARASALAGWAVDHSALGPHHALAQTAVRTASLGHAQANAALLPVTVRARRPAELERLDAWLGVALERVAGELRDRAGVDGLGAIATDDGLLDRAVDAATTRP